MPKCPKCNKEISALAGLETIITAYMEVENGEVEIRDAECRTYGCVEVWTCPECGEELFTADDEAGEFLKA